MQTQPQVGRQMGVWAATAVVTGEAISLGIFLTPGGMAKSLGSPALLAAVRLLRGRELAPAVAAETSIS